jgi:8-oxo-dGTP pyrophosphatase MutT (NUDIX family)
MTSENLNKPTITNLSPESKLVRVINIDGKFEKAQRPPGTRIIFVDLLAKKILITIENRHEHGGLVYGLPGGKVVDSLKEWDEIVEKGTVEEAVLAGAKREASEEVGIVDGEYSLLNTWNAGATVDWKLYYFMVKVPESVNTIKTDGEISSKEWITVQGIKDLIRNNQIKELQTVGALTQLLLQLGWF